MPVSDISNIAPILAEVARLNPQGVMDLGVGVGKYGVLCREILDGTHGRVQPQTWKHVIYGVEGFEDYANPIWGAYDGVGIGDFRKEYELVFGWDLVLLIDSLEHVEKTEALTILETLLANNKRVIVSVPVGNCPQGTCFGNELETHLSTWSGPAEFAKWQYLLLHMGVCCVVSIKGTD